MAVPAAPPAAAEPPPEDTEPSLSRFFSAEDGWLDISGFLDEAYGFVPIVAPVTEPAVGYGGAGALVFIDKPEGQVGLGRPNVSVLGGFATENGSDGQFAGDLRYWQGGRLQTLAGVFQASVNLDFYGLDGARSADDPRRYNLAPEGGLMQGKYRLGDSDLWAGLGYVYAVTQVGRPAGDEGLGLEGESRVGGLLPSLSYDTRDNLFTPRRGSYVEATAALFSESLGGDGDFQRVNLIAMHYRPLESDLVLGLRLASTLSYGDTPFYLRPFVFMRGVPAMRYQGERIAQVEAELSWRFWERFSLVGFGGLGAALNDAEGRRDDRQEVAAGGVGLRYELARKHGLHVGLDVAWGTEEAAIYVQFGNAWIRP
jgi:hypothetical protein